MPNFKEFIKGFEEKPEAEQPKTPEVKVEQPKPQENLDKRFEAEDKAIQKYLSMGYSKPEAQQKANIDVNYGGDFDKNYEYGEDKEWRKAQPKEEPNPSNYRQWRSNPENAKRENEADAKYKPLYDELDKKDDELYKAYYYEQDPKKKAELKAQMDENDKKINALLDEWGKATGYPETPEEKRAWASLENMSQPKQGNFQEAFGENEAEEYNAEDYQNAAPNREVAQKLGNAKPTDFSPYVFDTDQGRFSIVNDEQARKDGAEMIKAYFQDEQGFDTFPAEIAQDLKAKFGDPSQDEDLEINYQTVADYFIDKYGYSRMLTPHTGKVIDLGNGYKAYQITEKQGD